MKYHLITAAAAALTGLGALFTATPANASVEDYLDTLHNLGFYNSGHGDAGLLRTGYQICEAFAQGYTGDQIAARVYASTDSSINYTDAENVVRLAFMELCLPAASAGTPV